MKMTQLNDTVEFTSTSRKGMKTHNKRMHSERNKVSFLVVFEKCDVKLQSKRELNIHMKTHTYKDNYTGKVLNGFKCETCDFTEQDGWSMQIHHGKCHSKLFECGLCDFEANTL